MAKRLGIGGRKKKKETEAERLERLYRETGILPGVMQTPDILPEYGPAGIEEVFLRERVPRPTEPQVVAGPSTRITDPGARVREAQEGLIPEPPDPYQDVAIEEYVPSGIREGSRLLADEIPPHELEAQRVADAQAQADKIAADEAAYAEGRIYGNYSEDIGAKRQRYIDALEEIQTKARRLNMIAGLTGGTSQADSFTQAALARLDKMEEFHDDERLHQIRTGVYYDQNGNWNPPKSKKEAYDRAIQFGASAAEAAHISGGEPEAVAHVNWQYIGKDGEVPFGKVISTRRGEGVGDRPNPDDWVRVAGYQDESYTDATTHTNTLRRQLAAGDIKGAIDSDVLWRMARERRMEEPDARRRATDLMWSLIPPTERAEQLVTVEDWKNNEEEIERTLWQQGIRYIKVGTSDADAVLVALDEPAAIEGEIIEEEPDIPWWRHFSRF